MYHLSITPRITVTIGGVTRLYLAFVTTAPADLDLPRTLTVDEGRFEDVIGFAADSFLADAARIHATARVVLVEASDHAWQRATYRAHYQLFVAADRWLVSPEKLQSSLSGSASNSALSVRRLHDSLTSFVFANRSR